jgi:hypothetical protein
MNVQNTKFVFLMVFLFVAILLLSKDIFQFDLRDYNMSWGMTKDKVLKLKRKEIIENGTKIIFKDDKGKKWEGYLEYDDKGELFKIWFNIIDEAKPKNYKEYQAVKKQFVSNYKLCIKRMVELYGNKYNTTEIDDGGAAFEHNLSGMGMNSYHSDWVYQFYTMIDVAFSGGDTVGYVLVLQFISFRHFYEEIKQYNKENS